MPAPLAKGIIITLTLLTTLGAALMANPQVRAWVEEQRHKIAEALRSLGDELDPQSRRQAEAFAFEGRIPGQRPEAARRESEAARDAVAKATGRDGVDLDETSRRSTKIGRTTLGEADEAERRRLGREYLARRNQEMIDAKEKSRMRKSAASLSTSGNLESTSTDKNASRAFVENSAIAQQSAPPLGSFDRLVDIDGSLKADCTAKEDMESTLELPSPPTDEPKSFGKRKVAIAEIIEPEQEESRSTPISAFEVGSRWANPFGDEFEVEASGYATPKPKAPAVPPKISFAEDPETSVPGLHPESELEQSEPASVERSYGEEAMSESWTEDEQLARALSLSMADEESRRNERMAKQDSEDPDITAAIAASLADGSVHNQEHVQRKVDAAMQRSQSIMEAAMQQSQNKVEASMRKSQNKVEIAMQKKDRKLAAAQAKIMAKTSNLPQPEMTQRVEQLIDISSDPPISVPHQSSSSLSPRTPKMGSPTRTPSDDSDSLYGLSPTYTARRATHHGSTQPETRQDDIHSLFAKVRAGPDALDPRAVWSPITPQTTAQLNQQYDPVHEAASLNSSASFEPHFSSHAAASTTTVGSGDDSYASLPSLINVSDEPQRERQSLFHASNQHSIRNHIDSVYTHQLGSGMPSSQQQTQHEEISSKLALHAATLSLDQNNHYHSTYQSQPQSPPQHSQYFARYQSQLQDERSSPSAHADGNPRPRSLDLNGKHIASENGGDGTRTPTTATLSPEFERESIGFSTDSEDEFASAKGSVAHLPGAFGATSTSARRASTVSFVTDPAASNDLEDNGSLVGHSDAETSSLVDVDESPNGQQHGSEAGSDQRMEGVYSGEETDDDWSSGVKTPGSEWTDVGSQVSEEELGGQDSSRLIRS
ncbi:hypothetical protein BDV97DRAFT_360536 [Delphinella strobiligena]|nr:hypothetical protein BDV97DRAFT_360536 [Delphinella strobiligena]